MMIFGQIMYSVQEMRGYQENVYTNHMENMTAILEQNVLD